MPKMSMSGWRVRNSLARAPAYRSPDGSPQAIITRMCGGAVYGALIAAGAAPVPRRAGRSVLRAVRACPGPAGLGAAVVAAQVGRHEVELADGNDLDVGEADRAQLRHERARVAHKDDRQAVGLDVLLRHALHVGGG